jgi:phycobilisome rod-core linker protein
MDALIEVAYRQIFFHAFKWDREPVLESQLRSGKITVRDFIRGLLLSKTFRNSFYEKNSNYRFVEQCIQRILGRDVYSEREKIAWSIVVATKGIKGFVDELFNSEEYLENFGYDTVPYQRRRNLPSRDFGEIPFNIKSPRYDSYYRSILGFPQIIWQNKVRSFVPQAGNPSLFLEMARSLSDARKFPVPRFSVMNSNMYAMAPNRTGTMEAKVGGYANLEEVYAKVPYRTGIEAPVEGGVKGGVSSLVPSPPSPTFFPPSSQDLTLTNEEFLQSPLPLLRYPNFECPEKTYINIRFSVYIQLLLESLDLTTKAIEIEPTGTSNGSSPLTKSYNLCCGEIPAICLRRLLGTN